MAYYKKYDSNQPSAEDRALDRFAEMMIDKINTLQADWKKPWFTEGAMMWPKNLSGREYNGMNALMLMMHCEKEGYRIPVFMTFDRITGLNYNKDKEGHKSQAKDKEGEALPKVSVNKGEKSFPVFITTFTVVDKETKEKIKFEDYKNLSDSEKEKYNVYPKMNVYNVFNVDQTNLKESRPELYQKLQDENLPKKPEHKNGEIFSFPPVDKMIESDGWICPIKPTHGDDAYYTISKNLIVVPEKSQFRDGESFYGTTFHEMAHSTGAENQLDRLKPTTFGSKEYAREELVAELTAALVAQRYGITKNLKDDSAAYLKSWLSSLKESPDFLKSTLTDVKKASSLITQKIDPLMIEIGKQQDVREEKVQEQAPVSEYDIPQWAMSYILYGDAEGLTDKEQEMVDKFLKEKFPNGAVPEILQGTTREMNLYPAFGERNANALPSRGESPYQAVDTVTVRFHSTVYQEAGVSAAPVISNDETITAKRQETIAYACEHVTGEGNHTGFAWLRDSFNELCELTAPKQDMSQEEQEEHRLKTAQEITNGAYNKLSSQHLEKLIGALNELTYETTQEHSSGIGR